jgi:hypothetical protein
MLQLANKLICEEPKQAGFQLGNGPAFRSLGSV